MPPSSTPATAEGLAVFIALNDEHTCQSCASRISSGQMMRPVKEAGVLCLACAGLDQLVLLPSGNVALTRRAAQFSALSAKVLKWNRSSKRFERRGTLVEPQALQDAELVCLADAQKRENQREKAAVRRAAQDLIYIQKFRERILELYPACPVPTAVTIAEHACEKYSGRVGRAAFAKELEEKAITLAVRAHIRHAYTGYDDLLARGIDRHSARQQIEAQIDRVQATWQHPD